MRELCVFVRHDLARDPPFSRLDLISCRNVLIYFTPALQKRVLATFHYCLNSPGFLVLGGSESVSGGSATSSPPWTRARSSRANLGTQPAPVRAGRRTLSLPEAGERTDTSSEPALSPGDPLKRVDRLLFSRYAPPGVIVNEELEILQFRGHTGPYLEPAPGTPQFNLLKMAREGLLARRCAWHSHRAKKQSGPVRMEGCRLGQLGSRRTL